MDSFQSPKGSQSIEVKVYYFLSNPRKNHLHIYYYNYYHYYCVIILVIVKNLIM